MANRTTQATVRFTNAFPLPGFEKPQPAGDYRIRHDEELIEAFSRPAWRALAHSSSCRGSAYQYRRIRWCRSMQRTSMPHSKRTARYHERSKSLSPHVPSDPTGRPNPSLRRGTGSPAEGRLHARAPSRRRLSHHRHPAATRRGSAVSSPQPAEPNSQQTQTSSAPKAKRDDSDAL